MFVVGDGDESFGQRAPTSKAKCSLFFQDLIHVHITHYYIFVLIIATEAVHIKREVDCSFTFYWFRFGYQKSE